MQLRSVHVTVEGVPPPKKRPRARRIGNTITVYTPMHEREKAVADAIREQTNGQLLGVQRVAVEFDFWGPHGSSDIDNLVKLALDAVVKAKVIDDDRYVVRLKAVRGVKTDVRNPLRPHPCTVIRLWEEPC